MTAISQPNSAAANVTEISPAPNGVSPPYQAQSTAPDKNTGRLTSKDAAKKITDVTPRPTSTPTDNRINHPPRPPSSCGQNAVTTSVPSPHATSTEARATAFMVWTVATAGPRGR